MTSPFAEPSVRHKMLRTCFGLSGIRIASASLLCRGRFECAQLLYNPETCNERQMVGHRFTELFAANVHGPVHGEHA